jgi:putative photosynthetic complex assembly protein 2
MWQYGWPSLYAVLVWYFSTGVILYLDGLPRHTFRWSMAGATALLLVAFHGLAASRDDTSVTGAYTAFTCGLLAWIWQETSFYLGYITGPRTQFHRRTATGWRHFWHAVQAVLYHELAIVASLVVIIAITHGGANQFGLWTFLVLWIMQLSAKLNVFLGVRNLSEEFIPEHLAFVRAFLTRRPMNPFFPVAVTVASVVTFVFITRANAADAGSMSGTGYAFLATMMALAVIEHWFLILPLPFAALWRWWLRSRAIDEPVPVPVRAPGRAAA